MEVFPGEAVVEFARELQSYAAYFRRASTYNPVSLRTTGGIDERKSKIENGETRCRRGGDPARHGRLGEHRAISESIRPRSLKGMPARRNGVLGTVVLVHQNGKGFEVEFTTLDGETVAVVTLAASQVRVARSGEIAHARRLAQAA